MLRVLLLGATGTLGKALTQDLITDSEVQVTQFARHALRDGLQDAGTLRLDGDATDREELKKAIEGQDVVICAVSGQQLPLVAQNLAAVMDSTKRLIFMGAVGIYNEIPDGLGSEYNVLNEPEQVPNRQAVDVIEASNLNYTILRPGFLEDGEKEDFVLTLKGEPARGYITTISSLVNLIRNLIKDNALYVKRSVSITKNMRK